VPEYEDLQQLVNFKRQTPQIAKASKRLSFK